MTRLSISGDPLTLSSSTQADGYVTEIPYVAGYQRGLNPALQAFTLATKGIAAWQIGTPMTYLELGCGFGLSTLIHAAANPQATFIGIDILPEHVTTARELADAAGLRNVTFIEGSFASLPDMNLPECDFIAMHGVWSWINDANRAHILRCVDANLKPGGVLYTSYNALPGNAAALPVRQLMMTEFARARGTVPERIAAAIALVDRVKTIGGGFFADSPLSAQRFEELKAHPANYLAHEYFNADWQAFYFKDVAKGFAGVGLQFVSQADLFATVDDFHFTTATRAQIDRVTDPMMRETLRDYAIDRQFRADLYVRSPSSQADMAELMGDLRFFATVAPERAELIQVRTPLGDVAPPRGKTEAVLGALRDRPLSVREIAQHAAFAGMTQDKLTNFLVFGPAAFAAIEPAFPHDGEAERFDSARRFNRAVWEKNQNRLWTEANVSPITGGSIEVSREDQMYFLARAQKTDPVTFAAKALGAAEADMRLRYRAFERERLPAYHRFGVGA